LERKEGEILSIFNMSRIISGSLKVGQYIVNVIEIKIAVNFKHLIKYEQENEKE
jgi:hypothetical protein